MYKYIIINGKRYYDYYVDYKPVVKLSKRLTALNKKMRELRRRVEKLKREEKRIRKHLTLYFKGGKK